jgi:hypothetical protein
VQEHHGEISRKVSRKTSRGLKRQEGIMSEPCRHERAAGEAIRDAVASLAASDAAMEMATAELLAKDATIGRLDEDVAGWISRAVDAEATIERVKALHSRYNTGHATRCNVYRVSWPCPTIRAIEATS